MLHLVRGSSSGGNPVRFLGWRELASRSVHVALDATPLLGAVTGVGRYVAGLVGGLVALPDPPQVRLVAFTFRGARIVPRVAGTSLTGRRAPARLLQAAWLRSSWPPVEWLSGPVDVMHGTNFVLPPRRRAAGVLTIHDLAYLRDPGSVTAASLRYQRLVPRALATGGVIVTPSQATAEEVMEQYQLNHDRVVVTPLGIDPTWAATVPPDAAWLGAHGLPARYLLAVGSLEPRKDLATLVAAHARLVRGRPGTPPLVLVGPPGWGAPLAVGAEVVLTGYLSDDDLRRVVAGAELLAFPSRREGFGLPPLEALACGTPVVASDLPATREVLRDAALLVPAGDVAAFSDALAMTLDAGRGEQLDQARRRERAAGFTWNRCAAATLAAYQRALTAGQS